MNDRLQAEFAYWNLYKVAHGRRPRHVDTSTWSVDKFNSELVILTALIEENNKIDASREALSVVKFEERMENLKWLGLTRDEAIEYIHSKENTQGDAEYLCYKLNLPFDYFNKEA